MQSFDSVRSWQMKRLFNGLKCIYVKMGGRNGRCIEGEIFMIYLAMIIMLLIALIGLTRMIRWPEDWM